MMQLGASTPWPNALKQVTGTETLEAAALIEYFKPLHDWLVEQNKGHNVDWDEECSTATVTSGTNHIWRKSYFIVTVLYYIVFQLL